MSRLWTVALVVSATLFFAGDLNLTNGLLSGPPPGRAGYVPEHPPGRTVHIAPLGGFPPGRLAELVSFYAVRYDLGIHVLPPASIPDGARDYARNQLVGEALIDILRATYAEAADPNRVIIGVTSEDLYSRSIPEWRWAFGLRRAGQLAVVSTARMEPEPGPFGDRLEAARLRKMVTKNIGVLFFGLDTSSDPRNVLFNNILSVDDLDAMSEDF